MRPADGTDAEPSPAGRTALQPYWERVSRHAATDPLGAVCHPGAPAFLNRFFARFQERAVARCLGGLPLRGARALDVGCGFGRWTRWLAARGADPIGVDLTPGLLDAARRLSPGLEFRRMSATALELPDASFDLVVCVTVLQHLRPDEQEAGVAELCRVVRPGGRVFALDLIDLHDAGRVVHPRPPEGWIAAYERRGLALERFSGQEFVPLVRALQRAGALGARGGGGPGGEAPPSTFFERERGGLARALVHGALWLGVQVSTPLEVACEALLPARWGRHGAFLFRRP